jgi:thiamine biosynthesis lipoprotein
MNSRSLIFPLLVVLFACQGRGDSYLVQIAGNAQGTTYQISYVAESNINLQRGIDSILKEIDSSVSTYLPVSIISRINNNDTTVVADKYFKDVFEKAMEVSAKTNGAFDVTVAPVINALGFGFTGGGKPDSSMIDSLLRYVGYRKVRMENKKVIKDHPRVMLDFNAIAQGYTVDVIASYLNTKGVTDYLIELGGEVKAKGKKRDSAIWKVGIDQPVEVPGEGRPLQAVIKLADKAMATSGNYRQYHIEDGRKYAHIIDPRTGNTAKHNLLSATVLADDCMTADAYATAFMVMGLENSKRFLSQNIELNLQVHFIFDEGGDWGTYTSESLAKLVQQVD